MDLNSTITNNHKRFYDVNQSTSTPQRDINQMNQFCNNIDNEDQNNTEQFENVVCNVLNGINKTYFRKKIKATSNFGIFRSYCS